MFHPDKHNMDPNKQKWAEQIFNKVKEAYEVLSDSHKRAIYDTLGKTWNNKTQIPLNNLF